ncbi:NUDIX hydrolase, partial [Mycobacterium timonense]
EAFEEGVRREGLEETGLKVTVQRLTGVYKNLKQGIVALVYRCSPAAGDTHPTAEAREVRRMAKEEDQSERSPAIAVRGLDAVSE